MNDLAGRMTLAQLMANQQAMTHGAQPQPKRFADYAPSRQTLADLMRGGMMGVTTDTLGAPVDLVSAMLRPMGLGHQKPVMGSDWLAEKMTRPTGSGAETAARTLSGFLSPDPADLMKLAALIPGIYPPHGWKMAGKKLKDAISSSENVMPSGLPDKHQEGVASLIKEMQSRGLLPYTEVDKGGSVYVSALKKPTDGRRRPEKFGREYEASYGTAVDPFSVRFSDHGQYYFGPTISVDPASGNTPETALQYLAYIFGDAPRPTVGESRIIPSTGEQFGSAIKTKAR